MDIVIFLPLSLSAAVALKISYRLDPNFCIFYLAVCSIQNHSDRQRPHSPTYFIPHVLHSMLCSDELKQHVLLDTYIHKFYMRPTMFFASGEMYLEFVFKIHSVN